MKTKNTLIRLTWVCLVITLVSCGPYKRPDSAPDALFQAKQMENLDLGELLYEFDFLSKEPEKNKPLELKEFSAEDLSSELWKWRRNELQARIIGASNQRCGKYKSDLRDAKANTGFWMGTLTTFLAGASAVFNPESTAKALAAGAGAISGSRAEYDQAYFSNMASQVIISGIDKKRAEVHEEILKRKDESLKDYPIFAAVSDALNYHASCNVVEGLILAQNSIELKDNPGIKEFNKYFASVVQLRNNINGETSLLSTTQQMADMVASIDNLNGGELELDLTKWKTVLEAFTPNDEIDACNTENVTKYKASRDELTSEFSSWGEQKGAVKTRLTVLSKEYSEQVNQYITGTDDLAANIQEVKEKSKELLTVATYEIETLKKALSALSNKNTALYDEMSKCEPLKAKLEE